MTNDAKQADLSAYVLMALDDHLAEMRRIRDRMRVGSTTTPGARHALALDSIAVAESYAVTMSLALDPCAVAASPVFLA
jgi:hypothetical protein